jgi:hypothetical protein
LGRLYVTGLIAASMFTIGRASPTSSPARSRNVIEEELGHPLGEPDLADLRAGSPTAKRGSTNANGRDRNSPWVNDLERANRVHPNHSPDSFVGLRHFILPFDDSTFECVARSVEVLTTDTDDPLAAAARAIDPDL